MKKLLLYVVHRLAWTIPTLLLVSAMVFVLVRLIPGDPAIVSLGDDATAQQIADFRARFGLDQPIPVQFVLWLGQVVRGDLGVSITNGQAIAPLILDRFQVSATIVLCAMALAVLISVPLGLLAAWKQNSSLDVAIVSIATFLLAIPGFWLGLLMLMFFGLKLGWVPVIGYVPFSEDFGAAALYVALPIATLALLEIGLLVRMMRAGAVEVLNLEYVTHARAKGLSERTVLFRHVFPNAFAPTLTIIGLALGNLLGGIAVMETVFTLPGLGRLMVDAIYGRDYPVIQGCLLFTAFIYVLVNLIVDLLYPVFDPRVTAA